MSVGKFYKRKSNLCINIFVLKYPTGPIFFFMKIKFPLSGKMIKGERSDEYVHTTIDKKRQYICVRSFWRLRFKKLIPVTWVTLETSKSVILTKIEIYSVKRSSSCPLFLFLYHNFISKDLPSKEIRLNDEQFQ